jgi:hypothetical protein
VVSHFFVATRHGHEERNKQSVGIEPPLPDQRKEVSMFAAYIIVTVVAAAANIYAATSDFIRP